MTGDKNKPEGSFSRWIEHFGDGVFKTNKKGNRKIPYMSCGGKKYEKKWRRRYGKKELKDEYERFTQ